MKTELSIPKKLNSGKLLNTNTRENLPSLASYNIPKFERSNERRISTGVYENHRNQITPKKNIDKLII